VENNLRVYYRNKLPHLTPIGGTFFITFRTNDSVPTKVMQGLRFDYVKAVKTDWFWNPQGQVPLLPALRHGSRRISQAKLSSLRFYRC